MSLAPSLSPPVLAAEAIRIRGARTHNLRNVDLDIPHWRLVVITGLSGSGKSSLAFDTLLAEGQRQYIESLSTYDRQFFDQMERPDVDVIEGLQPTIALDQRAGATNPRSTVATVTEIYDFLRVLMARVGDVACPECGAAISQQTPAEIQASILALPEQTKVMLLAPMVRGRKGRHAEVMEQIRKEGFVRVRIDGLTYELDAAPELKAQSRHDIDAVVDRVIIRPGIENRLAESVRLALKHGEGALRASYQTPEAKLQANGASARENLPENGWIERVYNTQYACPDCKTSLAEIEPRTFSFNSPYGACPECDGLGAREGFVPELVAPDLSQSLAGGAIAPWRGSQNGARIKQKQLLEPLLGRLQLDWDTPLEKWPEQARHELLHGDGGKFLGVLADLEMDYAAAAGSEAQDKFVEFRGSVPCPACGGARLRPEARACRLGGLAIQQITALPIERAREFFVNLKVAPSQEPVSQPLTREIVRRLEFLQHVGLDYLSLDRAADTLSGGEMQRVRLATGIGSGLVGVLYILDEPSIGLHPRDNERLIQSLRELQQQGNTVLVVEHDETLMRAADWLIDVGPGAGERGGQIVAEGTPADVAAHPESVTGAYLAGRSRIAMPAARRKPAKTRMLELEGATLHNLKNVDVQIPLGLFTCFTGVSGSGKSSLVVDTLSATLARKLHGAATRPGPYRALRGASKLERLIHVDQSPIGRTPRSNPATYTGLFTFIRELFAMVPEAKARGYKAGRFSFNVKGGRCEACQGDGVIAIEMHFLPNVYVTCEQCKGRRYNRETLEIKYRGKSIADVLDQTVDQALPILENFPPIANKLRTLQSVGLGYIELGQSATTLSGGEAQRVKLSRELSKRGTGKTLYILDEPTTGLHFEDVRRLLDVLNRLVDQGNTIVVIEHNLDVIKSADWIVDLGPEGGDGGGRVVAQGSPEQVSGARGSHTGEFLAELFRP
jgi:excinuclease ABC subunit A